MWTRFFDMSSGGEEKLKWKTIYIEAGATEAIEIFKKKFKRDPSNVTCSCCGEDFSISEPTDFRGLPGKWDGKIKVIKKDKF